MFCCAYPIPGETANEPKALGLLGGPWDLVTPYDLAYNPTYDFPKWAYKGYPPIICRVITPVI